MTATQMLATNACVALGYSGAPIAGTSYTDAYVGEVAAQAMVKRRAEFPIVCGASPKQARRRDRQLHNACMMDVRKVFGIGLLAIVMGILGGPMGVILAIAGAVLSWLVERELNDDFKAMFSVAAMESS